MGFFGKVKSQANTFFGNVGKGAKSFVQQLPTNISKTRKAITSVAAAAKKSAEVVNYVNKGVQDNNVFGSKVKEKAAQANKFSDLGLQKIETYHKGADQFLGHLAKTPGIG